MAVWYNEIDPYAAQWLRNLIALDLIAPGDVDERDIRDVHPDDLRSYRQCHFFAGIGVWSHALRLAGWPDDRPIWTGSCPCQPFSAAGRGAGFSDERHLWPAFHHLIRECRPAVVIGEQVASKDGLAWLDLVQTDLEGTGYASAAVDLCAAGVGAPHIRQRLWWVGERLADAHPTGQRVERRAGLRRPELHDADGCRKDGGLADAASNRDADQRLSNGSAGQHVGAIAGAGGGSGLRDRATRDCNAPAGDAGAIGLCGLADADCRQRDRIADGEGRERDGTATGRQQGDREPEPCGDAHRPRPADGFWRDADWLYCRDGKWRPVEPGTFPLAHGAPARVGRLRAYGNAIVAQAAQAFIEAVM